MKYEKKGGGGNARCHEKTKPKTCYKFQILQRTIVQLISLGSIQSEIHRALINDARDLVQVLWILLDH